MAAMCAGVQPLGVCASVFAFCQRSQCMHWKCRANRLESDGRTPCANLEASCVCRPVQCREFVVAVRIDFVDIATVAHD